MDTRYLLDRHRRARGAVDPLAVAIIVVLAMLVIGGWFLIIEPHRQIMREDAAGRLAAPAATAHAAAQAPPVNVAVMDVDELLERARRAINEQRYLAPAGNNAFEFYLRVLAKQPGNQVAADALRETFPYAATSAEQVINARDFSESQRQIDLLAKADPTNFTLTILRSKLEAQRRLLDKQQQQVDQQNAQQLAAQKSAAENAKAQSVAEQQQIQKAAPAQITERQTSAAVQPAQPALAAAPAASEQSETSAAGVMGETRDAVLVKGAVPVYPSSALHAHQGGWAVVAFTVDPDGRTRDVHVTSSQPRHVFDHAAIDAVTRYRFTPAMKNGKAISSVRQQRIQFDP